MGTEGLDDASGLLDGLDLTIHIEDVFPGLAVNGRDSILVRLVPSAESSLSAATSEPGRFSTENARLSLFAMGSATASAVRLTRKKRV